MARSFEETVYVLKFGSSVLQDVEDLPAVAGEIYRQRRAGRRVVAVVSALAGETDRLFADAKAASGETDCAGWPELIGLGEERTAALLRIACHRIGLNPAVCGPEQLGLRTEGDSLNSQPISLDAAFVHDQLAKSGVIIVPGFVGVGTHGGRTLLGRGGSDYSAVFIGAETGAECVRLYKDVDGVFDRDPAQGPGALRYSHVSWTDALRVARQLIQPKAVEYARARKVPIEVEAIGSCRPTRVADRTIPPVPDTEQERLRIGLAGYGVVGQALVARLSRDPRFEIGPILVRNPSKPRAVPPPERPIDDEGAFLSAKRDIVVDVLSCEETGARIALELLPRGVQVVSASKRLISGRYGDLADAAEAGSARLLYSAAVGGSATVLETVDRARSCAPVAGVTAVLNGTVNFILSRLAQGHNFAAALAEAQNAGFAEEDCEADVSGADAAAKLRLIAAHAFGISPEDLEISTQPLDEAALDRIGSDRWVQLARLSRRENGTEASVQLVPASKVAQLEAPGDEWNCALVETVDGHSFRASGRGAGGAATAEAIVADLYDLVAARAQDRAAPKLQPANAQTLQPALCA
jgi:homoserine dehydrogenase